MKHAQNSSGKIVRLGGLLHLMAGVFLALMLWKGFSNDSIQVAIVSLSLCLLSFYWVLVGVVSVTRRIQVRGWWLSSSTLALVYILFELVFYFGISVGVDSFKATKWYNFACSNKAYAQYDSIRGYRLIHDSIRYVRIINDELVIDQTYVTNRQGFISNKEYMKPKPDGVKRYVVLGDSYTGADCLDIVWPDRLQQLLMSTSENDSVSYEFYSFALSGTGLMNWENIFFKEIIPNYEFDGVILAIYGNDLNRGFAIVNVFGDEVYFKDVGTIPQGEADFKENYAHKMHKIGSVMSDDSINELVNSLSQYRSRLAEPDMYFLRFLYDKISDLLFNTLKLDRYAQLYIYHDKSTIVNEDYIYEKYGNQKMLLLDSIINYSRSYDKEVIFASIPEEQGLDYIANGGKSQVDLEVSFLSDYYDVEYFNGYEAFSEKEVQSSLDSFFIKYDGHWTQQGSDYYANKFADYFRKRSN